ncbi:MAG: hypothetical protein LBD38_02925, partial [Streptococcaceae bacterium]|nr:hypothetical protein [Streptococcaceae bacterium]
MNQIKCPNCGEIFQVDQASFAEILNQVKNAEFDKELKLREIEIEQRLLQKTSISEAEHLKEVTRLQNEIEKMQLDQDRQLEAEKSHHALVIEKERREKDKEIVELQQQLREFSLQSEVKLKEKTSDLEKKLIQTENLLKNETTEKELSIRNLKEQH